MFYPNDTPSIDHKTPEVAGVGLQAQDITYYQIYEDRRLLNGMTFTSVKDARKRMRTLTDELRYIARGWYDVQQRLRLLCGPYKGL